MKINSHYKLFSFILIFLSISSFFVGFIYGENSAGAGTLNNDFQQFSDYCRLAWFLCGQIFTAIRLIVLAYLTGVDH